jgi:hypothetical protein
MSDALEEILGQVASGELSPADADAIIAALSADASATGMAGDQPPVASSRVDEGPGSAGRAVRVRVQEGGRTVVNLRIPMSWAGLTSLVPGLSSAQVGEISDALRDGRRGPIVDIQDADGDGVVISTE